MVAIGAVLLVREACLIFSVPFLTDLARESVFNEILLRFPGREKSHDDYGQHTMRSVEPQES